MSRRRTIACLALAAAALAWPAGLIASTNLVGDMDVRPVPRPPALDLDSRVSQATRPLPAQTGNPLWAVPLSALTVTRERPLFSASRRPPPLPVAARPVVQVRAAAAPPRPPQPPRLQLVGTVASGEGIAVFVDQTTQTILRLRTGEGHDGWVLRAVRPREVTLQNDRDTAILALPSIHAK
jgi:general secretion pathway protein N